MPVKGKGLYIIGKMKKVENFYFNAYVIAPVVFIPFIMPIISCILGIVDEIVMGYSIILAPPSEIDSIVFVPFHHISLHLIGTGINKLWTMNVEENEIIPQ